MPIALDPKKHRNHNIAAFAIIEIHSYSSNASRDLCSCNKARTEIFRLVLKYHERQRLHHEWSTLLSLCSPGGERKWALDAEHNWAGPDQGLTSWQDPCSADHIPPSAGHQQPFACKNHIKGVRAKQVIWHATLAYKDPCLFSSCQGQQLLSGNSVSP